MVLNKIREKVDPILARIGMGLGNAGIPPAMLTISGLALSIIAGILFAIRPNQSYIAAIALILAGLMDILDGSVARATSKVSSSGAFADSTLDRISEIAIYAGIAYGLEASALSVALALGFSITVSYLRAKGEALGLKISGTGIGERAERLLVIIVFSALSLVWLGVYIVIILAVVTIVQRYAAVSSAIRLKG